MNVSVARSPVRMLGYAALAVPLILLAVDMLFSHHWFPEPETSTQVVGSTVDASGATVDVTVRTLTPDGGAQHKRDLALGTLMLVGGVAAMGWSLKELLRPTVVLRADRGGLSLRVDGPRRPPRLIPWDQVVEVRSGLLDDDGSEVPVLSVRLVDPELVPVDPAGAEAEPPWLHLFADEWDQPAHQIAPLLDQLATRKMPRGAGS